MYRVAGKKQKLYSVTGSSGKCFHVFQNVRQSKHNGHQGTQQPEQDDIEQREEEAA